MKKYLHVFNSEPRIQDFAKSMVKVGAKWVSTRQVLIYSDGSEAYLRNVQSIEDAHKLTGHQYSAVLYHYQTPVMVPGEIMNYLSMLIREPADAAV